MLCRRSCMAVAFGAHVPGLISCAQVCIAYSEDGLEPQLFWPCYSPDVICWPGARCIYAHGIRIQCFSSGGCIAVMSDGGRPCCFQGCPSHLCQVSSCWCRKQTQFNTSSSTNDER